jgi:RNA polymerase subunit RPABC4/transcription elongation factor Spt4
MEQILAQIGDTIGGIFSSPALQFGVRAIGIYLVILWLASAYWAFRDMQQRSDNVILPYLAAAGIILFTPLFFVLAVWVYKIVRPHEKIGEVWERNLAEEALLAEVEAIHHCPTCERRIDDEWIICPTCRTRLNRVCPNCSRLVGLDWSLCAWCGKDFERRPIAAASLDSLPGVREVAIDRIAPAAPDAAKRPAASAAAAARTSARSSMAPSRTTSSSRSAGAARSAGGVPSAQDPLPER